MTISMSIQARQEMLTSMQKKYQLSGWAEKSQLLDGFIAATGYERKHAIKLLNSDITEPTQRKKRGKAPRYDTSVVKILEMLWHAANQICSKRLIPFLPELITALERHGHLRLTEDVKERVLSVSSATFDRLLRKERLTFSRSLSTTKSGTLLKNQIKVRTFADWDEQKPGFFECDLVAHCGLTVMGVFLNTLVMTDIVTTWTECIALIRKTADDVILGFSIASQLLPFKVLGIDVDNGCEFINYDVLDYCKVNNISFTRSRAYKKNDQAHVEQKNGSIVRRLIGYDRYETEEAWETMCELYAVLRLYINFFQPSLKLLNKIRDGSKTIKKYDKAKTPYQRVLSNQDISEEVKIKLTEQYNTLDPIDLKNKIAALQERLWGYIWIEDVKSAEEKAEVVLGNVQQDIQPKLYRKTKKQPRAHDWVTRKDPFEQVKDFVDLELQLNPNIHAKLILDKLMDKYPQDFCNGHLRTLQRRVNEMRAQQNYREQKYQDLMMGKSVMTSQTI
jgi:hypothetical protein